MLPANNVYHSAVPFGNKYPGAGGYPGTGPKPPHCDPELLDLKKMPCCTTSLPLPNPCQEAPGILTKLTSEDDIEAFLLTIKSVAQLEQCEEERWADILTPFLSGKAQRAYCTFPPDQAAFYSVLKMEILSY